MDNNKTSLLTFKWKQSLLSILIGAFTLLAFLPNPSFAYAWGFQDDQPNLWQTMGNHMQLLPRTPPASVEHWIDYYRKNPLYVNTIINNAAPYIEYIYSQTQKNQMPAEIALIPMIESNYNPFAISKDGAVGLWQIMPGTASGFGLAINWWYDGRRDIYASTEGALNYFSYLNQFFHGNWLLAIAAYDSGEGTVQKAIRYNKKHGLPTDYWDLHLPRETEQYVPKLLALAYIISDNDHDGINLPDLPSHPTVNNIEMHSQVDIDQAAKLAGVDPELLRELNPGFRRWATPPSQDYHLLIPADASNTFEAAMSEIPDSDKVTWQHHLVIANETLGGIAIKYHTRVALLKQINHLTSSEIHVGQSLLVPQAMHGKVNQIDLNLENNTIAEDVIPGPRRAVHTVKSQDNLWTIAQRNGVTVRQIRFWNKLTGRDHLHTNQQLLIWLPARANPKVRYDRYVVKAGDTIDDIAHHFHTKAHAIVVANKLKNANLHIGQQLVIPVVPIIHKHDHYLRNQNIFMHYVKDGDSLSTIAHKYHLSSKDLLRMNPHLKTEEVLSVGEPIEIYI
jgi:membrane-bound lytic murein transglycosylase D